MVTKSTLRMFAEVERGRREGADVPTPARVDQAPLLADLGRLRAHGKRLRSALENLLEAASRIVHRGSSDAARAKALKGYEAACARARRVLIDSSRLS